MFYSLAGHRQGQFAENRHGEPFAHRGGFLSAFLHGVDRTNCPTQLRRHTFAPERLGNATSLLKVVAASEEVYALCGPDFPGVLAKDCVQELAGGASSFGASADASSFGSNLSVSTRLSRSEYVR